MGAYAKQCSDWSRVIDMGGPTCMKRGRAWALEHPDCSRQGCCRDWTIRPRR